MKRRVLTFVSGIALTGAVSLAACSNTHDLKIGASNGPVTGDDCGGKTCGPKEYCAQPDGYCAMNNPNGDPRVSGKCTARPDACTLDLDPVCGCDGKSYGNACEAGTAGVSIASQGPCPTGPACGGFGGIACPAGQTCVDDPKDSCDPAKGGADCPGICVEAPDAGGDAGGGDCGGKTCAAKQYCAQPDGYCAMNNPNGDPRVSGTCTARPDACALDALSPVCGCDGVSYGSACQAAMAGASVASQGPCPNAAACGGFAGKACPTGLTCVDDPRDSCDPAHGGADCPGICVDGGGADAGVDGGGDCGGKTCGPTEYCAQPDGYCAMNGPNGDPRVSGKCTVRPDTCTGEVIPTCGCDGKEYSSPCVAATSGVSVAHMGTTCP